jgi:1,2-diacylglycerol 3-alpha-glucosyltransferase
MKIGMVTAVYKPVVNGVTHMISLYKQHLETLGHEVFIFTLGEPDPEGEEPGVVRSPAIPFGGYGYHIAVRYKREASTLLRQMDILHCHHLVLGVDLAHRYGCSPVVLTNHTRHDLYTGAYLPLPQQAADALMRQVWPEYTDMADIVIAPSDSVRKVMVQFGVTKPIKIVHNGVDLESFRDIVDPFPRADLGIPDSAVLAIYTGRLADEKNPAILLEQFALAAELVPDLYLLLVGRGAARESLERQAQQLRIHDRVRFFGSARYEDVPRLLSAADFYVTASVTEVHPLAVIEAMAVGLPIAASRSPGIIDTVTNGTSGFLTSVPEKGLAAAMAALATNPQIRAQMGAAARSECDAYDIHRTVAETVELYEELLEDRPDLKRERPHGRWFRPYARLRPTLRGIVSRMRLDDTAAGLAQPGGQDE